MAHARKPGQADNGTPIQIPLGLDLHHTLRGHKGAIQRIAWSPDGRVLASGSADESIRLWDIVTGAALRTLDGHSGTVFSVAWSPDGRVLASGSADESIRLWDAATGAALRTLRDCYSPVYSMAWSPDGRVIAAGGGDGKIGLWDVATGVMNWLARWHSSPVTTVAWSPDGRVLASGSADESIRLWDIATGAAPRPLQGEFGYVISVAWSPDGRVIAAGLLDKTIRLWDAATSRPTMTLEGHEAPLNCVTFSPDGQLLASKSDDNTVRLWRAETLEAVAILDESSSKTSFPGLAFHPALPILATLGEYDRIIRVWDLNYERLLGQVPVATSRHYTTGKIVLVGDSGVGKTGLGWRLALGKYKKHSSTHGQQFWPLKQLGTTRRDGTECEAVLWDLAGQPDYRLIHGLFLDDADLALVLFDPSDRQEPLRGVDFWIRALARRKEGRCRIILVGARLDRGDPTLTAEEIDAYCRDRGIAGGYVGTSALRGSGLKELLSQMAALIAWDEMTATVTTDTFKRIKDYVLRLKEDPGRREVLTDPAGLYQRLQESEPGWQFDDAELKTAVGHLTTHGYVRVLRTALGSESILLVPELLNNLAASFVLESRRHPRGLGALEERRVLDGDYGFPELVGLSKSERETLLDAATTLFLKNTICFREHDRDQDKVYLVFPELINLKKPVLAEETPTEDDISYTIVGAVENVFASMVVLLGYTNDFTRTDQWQNQAQYELSANEVCGFRQLAEREGAVEFVLYYGTAVPHATRRLFQGLFEKFLGRRSVEVKRFPPLVCDGCNYRQERATVVRRTAEGHDFLFCSNCGDKIALRSVGESLTLSPDEVRQIDHEQGIARLRTRFEAALVQVKAIAGTRDKQFKPPTCFISYAWGVPEHERWVEKRLAVDLRNAEIDVILDRWHNATIGANIDRFISRIEKSKTVLAVGTPQYRKKYENKESKLGYVVAAEVDLINLRLRGTERQKQTVLPVLLDGTEARSFPPMMRGKVYADFRKEETYFATLFDLILSLYAIPFDSPAISDLRESMQPDRSGTLGAPGKVAGWNLKGPT